LYSAAFIKRHVAVGPNGIGAIYQITNADGTPGTPSLFVDLAAQGIDVGGGALAGSPGFPSNAARGLGEPTAPSADAAVFGLVGKQGLGDLDISSDGSTLWVVNLYAKTLVQIPVATPTAPYI